MIGFDSGIFIGLFENNLKMKELWTLSSKNKKDKIVSCLSLYEIQKVLLRKRNKKEIIKKYLEVIQENVKIIWLDEEILNHAINLSLLYNLPAMDSLILSSLVKSGANVIYTTDSDFEKFKHKRIKIRNIN